MKQLLEATFNNESHLKKHYDRHVLKEGEKFNPYDPKFPHMTLEEYADAAEALTLATYKNVETRDELMSTRSGVVGWVANNESWKNPRNIKIKLNSDKMPGYMEIVAYTESYEDAGNQVYTYMLARGGKKNREFNNKVGNIGDKDLSPFTELEKEQIYKAEANLNKIKSKVDDLDVDAEYYSVPRNKVNYD